MTSTITFTNPITGEIQSISMNLSMYDGKQRGYAGVLDVHDATQRELLLMDLAYRYTFGDSSADSLVAFLEGAEVPEFTAETVEELKRTKVLSFLKGDLSEDELLRFNRKGIDFTANIGGVEVQGHTDVVYTDRKGSQTSKERRSTFRLTFNMGPGSQAQKPTQLLGDVLEGNGFVVA